MCGVVNVDVAGNEGMRGERGGGDEREENMENTREEGRERMRGFTRSA